MRPRALFLSLVVCAIGACTYRPPRFSGDAPVTELADDAPIPVPATRDVNGRIDLSEIYLQYAVESALDPSRVPPAGDVNARDDVPRSSWLDRESASLGEREGPPRPPLTVLDEGVRPSGLSVVDARGLRFELQRDPKDRPEMRTAATVIASRLVREIGYHAPAVFVTDLAPGDLRPKSTDPHVLQRIGVFLEDGPGPVAERYRVSATRWPLGLDLGPTPASAARDDDPNDRIPHRDRRVLRAWKAVTAWLKLTRAGDELFRDAYVGPRGEGHVVHMVLGLDSALGADAVVRSGALGVEAPPEDPVPQLVTFGLTSAPRRPPTQTRWPALGEIGYAVTPADERPWPPFEPSDRAQRADLYWIAKRMAAIPEQSIREAIAAGQISDPEAAARLAGILVTRRRIVVGRAYARVTPCEVTRVGEQLVMLRDESIAFHLENSIRTRYVAQFLGDRGNTLAPPASLAPELEVLRIAIPDEASKTDYLVVRLWAWRDGVGPSSPMEVHLAGGAGGLRVVGVLH